MMVTVASRKLKKGAHLASKPLKQVRFAKLWVPLNDVKSFCGFCVSLTLAMPWAMFHTRSLCWDMSSGHQRHPRGRVHISYQTVRDLRKGRKLSIQELSRRPMVTVSSASVHADAAEVGYGSTLNTEDLQAGVDGFRRSQGIWDCLDRAMSITYRALKAVRLLLSGFLRQKAQEQGHELMLLHVANRAVFHIANSFVSTSRSMMRDLRSLKRVLDAMSFIINAEWLQSVANKFVDGLSRRFPRGDLQIRLQRRRSVMGGMGASKDAFPYRPLGYNPFIRRGQAFDKLSRLREPDSVLVLRPPVDLIAASVSKLETEGCTAILIVPNWQRHPWHSPILRPVSRVDRVK